MYAQQGSRGKFQHMARSFESRHCWQFGLETGYFEICLARTGPGGYNGLQSLPQVVLKLLIRDYKWVIPNNFMVVQGI